MNWTEIADRVYVTVEPLLRVNVTLVVGDGQALLVDTLSHDDQARELLAAVRTVTPAELTVVNTHHHFDHSFGNTVIGSREIWGHEEAARLLRENGDALQRGWYESLVKEDEDFAERLGGVVIRPPDRTFHREATVDAGGRRVALAHLGRGHTGGDLIVEVPDAGVTIAGDLVEEGAPPGFGDAYPIAWPDTLAALCARLTADTRVVPGHGAVVGKEFVVAQHAELTALAWLIRDAHADRGDPVKVARKTSLHRFGERGAQESLLAVARGYEELDAEI